MAVVDTLVEDEVVAGEEEEEGNSNKIIITHTVLQLHQQNNEMIPPPPMVILALEAPNHTVDHNMAIDTIVLVVVVVHPTKRMAK